MYAKPIFGAFADQIEMLQLRIVLLLSFYAKTHRPPRHVHPFRHVHNSDIPATHVLHDFTRRRPTSSII